MKDFFGKIWAKIRSFFKQEDFEDMISEAIDETNKLVEDSLVVYYYGKPVLKLNRGLLDRQGCWENLEKIKLLHKDRIATEEAMATAVLNEKDKILQGLFEMWTDIQYQLQYAWKFELNSNYHRFWEVPGCKCPKVDNEDAYPTGYYSYNAECPVHKAPKKDPFTLGQYIESTDFKTVTNYGRFSSLIDNEDGTHNALILCTVGELEKVVKQARNFQKTKTYKEKPGLFFKHLSPDVSFGFLAKSNDHFLKREEAPKSGLKDTKKTKNPKKKTAKKKTAKKTTKKKATKTAKKTSKKTRSKNSK